jgi:hypothetical protein
MAWYDDKENNTGALTTTLAVDVAQIQGVCIIVVLKFVFAFMCYMGE